MLKMLRLERFKNFKEAELMLGPLTLLVGANASGKSNIRDAFQFLHGIVRGFNVAEIMGGKRDDYGVLQLKGIRGGTREIAFQDAPTFTLEITFSIDDEGQERDATYRIEVAPWTPYGWPKVMAERLAVEGYGDYLFESRPGPEHEPHYFRASVRTTPGEAEWVIKLRNHQPILSQFLGATQTSDVTRSDRTTWNLVQACLHGLRNMRFLDLSPDAMRLPALAGQTILGDQGENLASVLQRISANPQSKQALLQWVQELTPMDVKDFRFQADLSSHVQMTIVEENGHETTVHSASDGTLRFLALIAALLGPEPARFYFFEELDNGIYPARLYLLLQLVEQQVARGTTQMVATTHSPQLLRLLSPASLEYASLIYRLESHPDAQIIRIRDIPEARRLIEEQDLARLHESGWLEDAVAFKEEASV